MTFPRVRWSTETWRNLWLRPPRPRAQHPLRPPPQQRSSPVPTAAHSSWRKVRYVARTSGRNRRLTLAILGPPLSQMPKFGRHQFHVRHASPDFRRIGDEPA